MYVHVHVRSLSLPLPLMKSQILHKTDVGQHYSPHLTERENEILGVRATYLKSHSKTAAAPETESRMIYYFCYGRPCPPTIRIRALLH